MRRLVVLLGVMGVSVLPSVVPAAQSGGEVCLELKYVLAGTVVAIEQRHCQALPGEPVPLPSPSLPPPPPGVPGLPIAPPPLPV